MKDWIPIWNLNSFALLISFFFFSSLSICFQICTSSLVHLDPPSCCWVQQLLSRMGLGVGRRLLVRSHPSLAGRKMVTDPISFDLEHFYTPDVCSQHSQIGCTSLEAEVMGECDRDIQVQQHKSYANATVLLLAQAGYPAALHHVDLWAWVSTSLWISALGLLLGVGTHIFADVCVRGPGSDSWAFCILPFPTPILELWQAKSPAAISQRACCPAPHSLPWLNLESHLSLGPSKLLDWGSWCFTLNHSPKKKSGQLWSSKCKGGCRTFVFSMPWNKLSSKAFLREMLLIAFKPHEKTQMDDDGVL